MMNTRILCKAINIPIAILLLSAPAYFANASDAQDKSTKSNIQTTILQSGQGYELKEMVYATPDGQQQSSTLYFIHSIQGAKNAATEAGLPDSERDGAIIDFQHKNCNKDISHCDATSTSMVVIDKGIAEQLNDSDADFNRYIVSRGLRQVQTHFMGLANPSMGMDEMDTLQPMYSCNHDTNGDHTIHKKLEFPLRDSHTVGSGSGSVTSQIDANFIVDANAKVYYQFGSKLCVPYKVKIKKMDAAAKYQITGNIDINGQVSGRIPTFEWHSYRGNIGTGLFMVGPIPVEYSIRLPISAGVGDIVYQANGDVGLKKQLQVDGYFEFECTSSSCKRISSFYDDHGLIQPDDIKYSLMAEISLEPHVNVMLDANIYNDLLWAQAGADAKLPLSIIGYYGNTCGNGNGIGQEETVAAGLINVDLNVNAYAHGNTFKDQYWPIINKNLFFSDFVNPSTALSPLVRPSVQGQKVDLLVAVRSCVNRVPSSYQNYVIDWGDGSTETITHMNGSKDMLHQYSQKGNYIVKVKHESGPSTTVYVAI